MSIPREIFGKKMSTGYIPKGILSTTKLSDDITLDADSTINPELGELLLEACKNKIEKIALTLIDTIVKSKNTEHLIVKNKMGETSLILACKHSLVKVVKLLLKYRVPTDVLANDETALSWACKNNNVETSKMLIDAGADLLLKGPLFTACRNGFADIAHMIIAKIDIKRINTEDICALVYSLIGKMDKTVNKFIDKGIDVNYQNGIDNNKTLLMKAYELNSVRVVEKLIDKNADVNKLDKDGHTLLMKMCCNYIPYQDRKYTAYDYKKYDTYALEGKIYVCEANIIVKSNMAIKYANGDTPLLYAVKMEKMDIANLICSHLNSTFDINVIDNKNCTVLMWLLQNIERDMFTECFNKLYYKYSKKININLKTNNNNTLLIQACYKTQPRLANVLLYDFPNMDVNVVNMEGKTAMQYAFKYKLESVIIALLRKNAKT
ncbi:MAG: ankyrin [Faunusvirus sp.]|jgi:ankyrin repeat protein|uniref:Ankyrin n=1 Tax=Faunusvirus sp. TaxID=2487766 RepID=A0A3G4ZVV7_9VIRU|nr:MAG: ankyrin [Faunusvirus sp.]